MLSGVAWHPDGQSIATVGYDHSLRVWDIKTGAVRFRRVAHKLEGLSVAFDKSGKFIATAGWDKIVKIWDARTGEELHTLRGNRGVVTRVLFSPVPDELGRDNLISLNDAGELRWWDAGQEQTARVRRLDDPAQAIAFSPKGRFLAIFCRESSVRIDELTPPNPPAAEPLANMLGFGAVPPRAPTVVAMDAAPERLAYADMDDQGKARSDGLIIVRRRDPQTGAVTETTLKPPPTPAPSQAVNALAFSPDGRCLAVGAQDFSVMLWDAREGKFLHRLTGHLCFVSCVAFSPDGNRLVSGSEDWTVKVWDIAAGRATLTLWGHTGRIRDVAFSPDGKLLASASEDGTVRVWPGVVEPAAERRERRERASGPPSLKRGSK